MTTSVVPVDPTTGFQRFDAGTLTGFDALRAGALDALRRRRPWLALRGRKSYLRPVLTTRDLSRRPEIVESALQPVLLDAAATYLGEPPRLRSVQVFWTRANRTLTGSQRYHRDHVGERQLKAFAYLSPVGPENGPISLLPADASDRVVAALGRSRGRFDDAEIERAGEHPHRFELLGDAGTGLLADTTRCLHFGGRTREGERLLLMLQYVRPRDDVGTERGVLRPRHPAPERLDAMQRHALGRGA